MKAQIPPKRNRKEQRHYDKELYKSKDGGASLPAMQNAVRHSWSLFTFAVLPYGLISRDDTIYM